MNWKRLIGWPWFVKAEKREMETGWENDPWMLLPEPWMSPYHNLVTTKGKRMAHLAAKRVELMESLAKAKAQKKARKHTYAALEANTRERLRIEGGE